MKWRVGDRTFNHGCDASEWSWMLCAGFKQSITPRLLIRQFDDRSWGVWDVREKQWVKVFLVERLN